MRVIAGALGGRRLRAPKGRDVRPTADRVREALFSSLAGTVVGAHVLDLYAGSGALGIEALSRGAGSATFVERSPAVAAVLRGNLAALGLSAPVATCPVAAYARGACPTAPTPDTLPAPFDLVLADPPYDHDLAELLACLDALRRAGRLVGGATVVVERGRRGADVLPPWLDLRRRRAYGDSVLLYLSVRPTGAGPDDRHDDRHDDRDDDRGGDDERSDAGTAPSTTGDRQ